MLRVISFLLVASLALAQDPDPRCLVDRPRPIHIPHESDCGLYYLCHLGQPILMPRCPVGMNFDTISSQCRPEADAFCGETPTIPPTLPPTPPPSSAPSAPVEVPTVPIQPPTAPTGT